MTFTIRNCTFVWIVVLAIAVTCRAQKVSFKRSSYQQRPVSAIAYVYGASQFPGITGQFQFNQPSAGGPVIVRGVVMGLTPGLHGIHVHQTGNLTDDCKAAGPHFNPYNKTHGAQSAHDGKRHVGDLGNIEALDIDYPKSATVAHFYLVDPLLSLSPTSERNILYRSVVIHERADDLGLGSHEDSKKTGNSGGRVACGIITLVPNRAHRNTWF